MAIRLVEAGAEARRGLIAMSGPSNSGKTFSALRIATGIRDGLGASKRIALLDTEGRGHFYEHRFDFDRYAFDPPFSPADWRAAFTELDAKYSVVISDNFSDLHEGIGGLCEMAAASTNPNDVAKWAKPKAENKQLMAKVRLLTSQHIFLLRASEKIKIIKGQKEPEQLGWQPVCEKNLIYDVTLGWQLPPNSQGYAAIWKSIDGFDFKDGEQLSEAHGQAIARWVKGEAARGTMRSIVKIIGADGSVVCTTSLLEEAVTAYKTAEKAAPDYVPMANLSALKVMAEHADGKLRDQLQARIVKLETTE
jgi:hypothetical protein